MKERPILFSAPMVRALLDGSKTQTRRVITHKRYPVPSWATFGQEMDKDLFRWSEEQTPGQPLRALRRWPIDGCGPHAIPCPYGQPGDRLWVREAWRIGAWSVDDGSLAIDYLSSEPTKTPWISVPEDSNNYHCASVFENYWIQSTDDCIKSKLSTDDSGTYHWAPGQSPCRKRPSIHMPRWASRITLEITAVRVERLQDISEADAVAEGIERQEDGLGWKRGPISSDHPNTATRTAFPRLAYQSLWEQINGPDSWEENPWVWAIEFKRINQAAA